jgi:hypothetical protein
VSGVSSPPELILISGVPTVEATAIPPLFAVVSFETSLPNASVVKPTTISLSVTLSSLTARNAVVPPTVMFPPTYKLEPSKVRLLEPVATLEPSL